MSARDGDAGTIASLRRILIEGTLLDVPLLQFLRTISSWGLGLVEVIEAAERARPAGRAP